GHAPAAVRHVHGRHLDQLTLLVGRWNVAGAGGPRSQRGSFLQCGENPPPSRRGEGQVRAYLCGAGVVARRPLLRDLLIVGGRSCTSKSWAAVESDRRSPTY